MQISSCLKLRRIEFVVTRHCTGRCIHCSEGGTQPSFGNHHIDTQTAVNAVSWLAAHFPMTSVMTFGGEPLLYPETVCAIHETARACGIEKRQLITNGWFSKDPRRVAAVAAALHAAGVNDLLLSVDAFHQQTIPLDAVRRFAGALQRTGLTGLQLQPAWLVNAQHQNPYNEKTREVLSALQDLQIPVGSGNDIFMAGNALRYLSDYYEPQVPDLTAACGTMPYTEPLWNLSSLSVEPNGDVIACAFVIGNLYRESMETIVTRYDPYAHSGMRAVMTGGVAGLMELAAAHGICPDISGCRNACQICRKLSRVWAESQ